MTAAVSPLSLPQLEQLLHDADPSAFLVAPRKLRRVIKQHGHAVGFVVQVPHRSNYAIDGATLAGMLNPGDLHPQPQGAFPAKVILLPRPDADTLASAEPAQILRQCWRQLFHAHVHLALEAKVAAGTLTDAVIHS